MAPVPLPSASPTDAPSSSPSVAPVPLPSASPSSSPSVAPVPLPSASPSSAPSDAQPSSSPSEAPVPAPSASPSDAQPSSSPSEAPPSLIPTSLQNEEIACIALALAMPKLQSLTGLRCCLFLFVNHFLSYYYFVTRDRYMSSCYCSANFLITFTDIRSLT